MLLDQIRNTPGANEVFEVITSQFRSFIAQQQAARPDMPKVVLRTAILDVLVNSGMNFHSTKREQLIEDAKTNGVYDVVGDNDKLIAMMNALGIIGELLADFVPPSLRRPALQGTINALRDNEL